MTTTVDADKTPTSALPVQAGLISVTCALTIIVIVGVLFAVAAFLPAYGAATFCVDFITAVLLLAQSSILHDRARSHLGRACLFSALIIPHLLSFSGVFGVRSIIGNSRNGHRVSLLIIDIDQFKAFNDRYGHSTGDGYLKAVAVALASVPHRPADPMARIGGEEFAVLLPDTGQDGAMEVARTLNAAVSALGIQHAAGTTGIVTCSIGVCTQRPVASTVSSTDLVARADAALYVAKRDGRNRARFFTEPEPILVA